MPWILVAVAMLSSSSIGGGKVVIPATRCLQEARVHLTTLFMAEQAYFKEHKAYTSDLTLLAAAFVPPEDPAQTPVATTFGTIPLQCRFDYEAGVRSPFPTFAVYAWGTQDAHGGYMKIDSDGTSAGEIVWASPDEVPPSLR